jgi:hypothetical protein
LNLDVGFCYYEKSVETVKRCIESLKDHVRYIYAVDGKFEFYESEELLSSPEVRDYLKSIPNVIMINAPNLKENKKRQIYLDYCEQNNTDYLLIIDADCYVTTPTDWEEFYNVLEEMGKGKKPKILCIAVQVPQKLSWFPLLWYKPHLFQYMETHNFWKDKTDGSIYKSTNNGTRANHFFIKSNDKLRDEAYLQKSRDYQAKLIEYERPFKEEYRKTAKNVSQPKEYGNMVNGIPVM